MSEVVMDFSQRMGYLPASKVIQSDSIDKDLRNTLWNILSACYWNKFYGAYGTNAVEGSNYHAFVVRLYASHYKFTIDTIPWAWSNILEEIRAQVLQGEWHRAYSLIEFIYENAPEFDDNREEFIFMCNEAFTRENSAYRFVDGQLTPITSKDEIEEIERAIADSDQYAGVRTHIQTSLRFLTDKQNPDYRNSIKESISAVESLAKKLVGDEKATLGQALKVLEKHHNLHPSLKTAFSALYGYTNDANGIRHSLMDNESTLTQADARFMLICCSAFTNFAIDSTKS
ncbi:MULTISPECIES: AbiJ-NTD4 domain-containing protein [unclassified Pseudomonas]|uniref:AbiJ-NTD4 domain-containing protein n=1 Tax=unclassified Pseudomonas TaxID=196821 RepID=UPI000C86B251|nr:MULTISPECIES: hypothetical protein [unclassified Pseudomonas]PMU16558.1 hypothetical protein C1X90_27425 [Pseudomonas sp. GP01-A9]PMU23504.1 hypothetical protein C1X88_27085 [Pseudomonas sp. GP01-A13]PMU33713.1 hypothetical protein C1X89_26930 [Pseudomonas sp. GP01-A8]PMU48616.1 hypothetical protein C1X85_29605 [Pseudomonas sp. GP01-A6]PMU48825.1 hypothetical protein C1X87_18950 [Pseudomonas sp. GP01-A14]